ncbi:MAG TPA: hypothetical protein VFN49_01440 [Candidatus Aquilonibacter sp.]|nr:hypothetical protein [Candidatus Aquilonibacter sp.]
MAELFAGVRQAHPVTLVNMNPRIKLLRARYVKLLLEILLSIFLHPIAMVLMWINVLGRTDMSGLKKAVWFAVSLLWGLGPIVYVLVADGGLW